MPDFIAGLLCGVLVFLIARVIARPDRQVPPVVNVHIDVFADDSAYCDECDGIDGIDDSERWKHGVSPEDE